MLKINSEWYNSSLRRSDLPTAKDLGLSAGNGRKEQRENTFDVVFRKGNQKIKYVAKNVIVARKVFMPGMGPAREIIVYDIDGHHDKAQFIGESVLQDIARRFENIID